MILENIHCLLQFDDRGNLLALVSKSSGRNYIVKDGCSLFRLTMTEIIENRVMPGTLALTGVSYRITCNNGNQRTLINP